MKTTVTRRGFIKSAAIGAAAVSGKAISQSAGTPDADKLDAAANLPVLRRSLFPEPVTIASLRLLKNGDTFLLEAKSKQGAVGYAISNEMHMTYLYPLLIKKVIPYFIGKDAGDLDALIDGVYRTDSNYKYQGLAFWVCVATVEFSLLDLLGRIAGKSMGELFSDNLHREISVYRANNYRGKSAEESVELIQKNMIKAGAKAVKFKVGGRMNKNQDDPPGRTEKLIPLVRKVLGDDITIYADSNGSYDAANSIRVGRMLQDIRAGFFEEPCPFDHYEETKQIADSLDIPIAGGEQDSSLSLFQWMISRGALQVVQPDLFYFGGMVRSVRVSRMAHTAGLPCTPHISGSGLGYLYMMHFVSAIPNPGPYHEFKGLNQEIPFHCATSTLTPHNGIITTPSGPGLGIELDPTYLAAAKIVEA